MLIGIVGTSIGVGLSFTVNRMVENHKQQKAQRETAIMAVYDIEEILRQVKEEKELEDSLFEVTMYVSTHPEEMETMSEDTLRMVITYLLDDPTVVKGWTVDTRENAFNSSMDARRNLGSAQFYDNVQACYQVRRELKQYVENTQAFKRPLSSEDYEQFLLQLAPEEIDYSSSLPQPQAAAPFLKLLFQKRASALYLKRYFQRRGAYRSTAINLERLNRENKYLMNIGDKDMKEYVRQNVDRQQPATTKLIEGTWEMTEEDESRTYKFYADSTTEMIANSFNQIELALQAEKTVVYITTPLTLLMKGKWALKGDSIVVTFDNETFEYLSFDVDWSNLPKAALERAKDSMEIKEQGLKDYSLQVIKQRNFNFSRKVTLDISGNTMLWILGEKNALRELLFRKEEQDSVAVSQ